MAGFRPVLQNHDVAVEDVLADHGLAGHAQGERVPRRLESDARHIHRHTAFRLLRLVLGETGRDGAEQRNIDDPAAELLQR